jgi:hypothetical protein
MDRRKYDGPVIITGCLEQSDLYKGLRGAVSTTDKLRHLTELFGSESIAFSRLPPSERGQFGYREDGSANFLDTGAPGSTGSDGRVRFAEFAERLLPAISDSESDVLYMQAHPVPEGSPLDQAAPPLPYLQRWTPPSRQIWIGSGRQVVNLHRDFSFNLISMYEGTKRVALFPPHALGDLYPSPLHKLVGSTEGSLVRLLSFDREKFPRIERLMGQGQLAVLNAGDVLYIPPRWWHHVESFGLNVMINSFIPDLDMEMHSRMIANFYQAMGLFADLPPLMRSAYGLLYRRQAFSVGQSHVGPELMEDEDPSTYVPNLRTLAGISEHLISTLVLYRSLPPYWCDHAANMFDYYVFRLAGDPFPTLPRGEYRRMLCSIEPILRQLVA